MKTIKLFKNMETSPDRSPTESFCDCIRQNIFACNCGEDNEVNWSWDNKDVNEQILLSNDDREVKFHPGYSSGTAAVRGQKHFQPGYHYYWEIKMLSSLYGTDVMVGVGTEKVELGMSAYRFCSMLGQDDESWGYSYRGVVQHNGMFSKYGPRFGQGSIVGVHLDMCAGTLEFYHNRKPLGVAFTGLGSFKLYPMVSSTAAKSAVRVTCAVSCGLNLQRDCLQIISRDTNLVDQFNAIPGLKPMLSIFWWLFPAIDSDSDCSRNCRKRKSVSMDMFTLHNSTALLVIPPSYA